MNEKHEKVSFCLPDECNNVCFICIKEVSDSSKRRRIWEPQDSSKLTEHGKLIRTVLNEEPNQETDFKVLCRTCLRNLQSLKEKIIEKKKLYRKIKRKV